MKKIFTALVVSLALFGLAHSVAAETFTTTSSINPWQALNQRLVLPKPVTTTASTSSSSSEPKTVDLSRKKIYMYGDSYTVRALNTLEKTFPEINAKGVSGINYLNASAWFKNGVPKDAEVVVYALGTNVPETVNIDEALKAAGDRPVFWINCYTLNIADSQWSTLAQKLTDATEQYPNLTIVDWRKVAKANPNLFDTDGIHPNTTKGIQTWVDLLHTALENHTEK